MKRYKITHRTEYSYSDWVELLPHTLRLRPREGHDLRIESSTLDITPWASLRWHRDAEGNTVATATFDECTRHLLITSEIIVQQYNQQPMDFLISDYAINFPFQYDEKDRRLLSIYMRDDSRKPSRLVADLINRIYQCRENTQTFSLLTSLNDIIKQSITYRRREDEGVQPAEQTLSLASGSCQDMAYLYILTARELGFAARFVSGYVHSGASETLYGSTHAWAEVFIPGAGWKGFDPTNGTIAGADHIAVSVAHAPESVPPVSGKFNGSSRGNMRVAVMVQALP